MIEISIGERYFDHCDNEYLILSVNKKEKKGFEICALDEFNRCEEYFHLDGRYSHGKSPFDLIGEIKNGKKAKKAKKAIQLLR